MNRDWEVWRGKNVVTLEVYEEGMRAQAWHLLYAIVDGLCNLTGGRLCCWRLTYRFYYPLENRTLNRWWSARRRLGQLDIDQSVGRQLTHDWKGYDDWEDEDPGAQMTREIEANPEEAESLRRSRQQAEDGDVEWLDDDESTAGTASTWTGRVRTQTSWSNQP
jgi:hypothetical protein